MDVTNITLIGMTSCGKTTLGKKLANDLSMDFVDFDNVILNKFGRVIDNNGETRFKEIEQQIMLEANGTKTVYACGGSAVYSPVAMEHLQTISTIIYLYVPFDVIAARLVDNSEKQIIGSASKSLEDLYKEREPLYRKYADKIIVTHSGQISDQYAALKEIINTLAIT